MRKFTFSAFRWMAIVFLLFAFILIAIQVATFSRFRATFPIGMTIAGVPVDGLDRQQAAQRLLEAYNVPVELHYNDARIHLDPSVVGFELDLESMLAAADLERTKESFWSAFWEYLWGGSQEPASIPLRATYSEARLRTYLENEISPRYDLPPSPPIPIPGTVNFLQGDLGTSLDINRTIAPTESALRSTSQRIVTLPLQSTLPPRPSYENLEVLLNQTISLSGFDGLVGFYLKDLQNSQEIHFASELGEEISVDPDVAFTAASIIKIPVLISIYKELDESPNEETANLIAKMIEESGNEATDWLMQRVIDSYRAPLIVTENMQTIGLENTYLAGHFYLGAPLLQRFETPANTRFDITTFPDPYNQTTPSDIGMLLEDLHQCSEMGGSALIAVFPNELSQEECQEMIAFLSRNYMPSLLEAGLTEDAFIAHKHGWVTNDGIINMLGDAGIIYTPGGEYILSIFLYHPEQLIWDSASSLVGQLSRAVYNFYNMPQ
jgi:beta-lactamase class A